MAVRFRRGLFMERHYKKISMEKLYLQSCCDVGATPNRKTYKRFKDKYYSIKDLQDYIDRYEEENE